MHFYFVIPAKAGIHGRCFLQMIEEEQDKRPWIPAFAGKTSVGDL